MAEPHDNATYRALIALMPVGMTRNAWRRKAGLGAAIFDNIRQHGNPTQATLEKLLDAIGVSWAQWDAVRHDPETALTLVRSEVRASAADVQRDFNSPDPQPNMPHLGGAMGGDYDDFDQVEMHELHLYEVLEWVARPPALRRDEHAYMLTVYGDSMEPRFQPNEHVIVGPASPVSIGDDVIVQLRGSGEDERVKLVLIKRLVKRGATGVELRQFNPDKTFFVSNDRIARDQRGRPAIHRVYGASF